MEISLFDRQSDGMVPTAAARLFAPRIERALDHIGSARVTTAQMRALLALAQEGSYPGASQFTGLSQPTLHRALGDLAMALARPMVERRGKGIGFTDAGRRAIRGFRLARAELDAGLSELDSLKGRETGRISIGAMPLARARVLPAAVAAFHARFPDVRIAISEGAFGELIDPLRDGDLDLMIGALRSPAPGADIEQKPLFTDRPAIFARYGHPLSGSAPTLAELATFPLGGAAAGHAAIQSMEDDIRRSEYALTNGAYRMRFGYHHPAIVDRDRFPDAFITRSGGGRNRGAMVDCNS